MQKSSHCQSQPSKNTRRQNFTMSEGVLKTRRFWTGADGLGRLNGDRTHATCISKSIETKEITSHFLPRFRHTKAHQKDLRPLGRSSPLKATRVSRALDTPNKTGLRWFVNTFCLFRLVKPRAGPVFRFPYKPCHPQPQTTSSFFFLPTAITQPYFDYNRPSQSRHACTRQNGDIARLRSISENTLYTPCVRTIIPPKSLSTTGKQQTRRCPSTAAKCQCQFQH